METRMDKIRAINADMTKLDNGNSIRFWISVRSLPPPTAPSPKLLCLTNYTQRRWLRIWAEGMAPLLEGMMKQANPLAQKAIVKTRRFTKAGIEAFEIALLASAIGWVR